MSHDRDLSRLTFLHKELGTKTEKPIGQAIDKLASDFQTNGLLKAFLAKESKDRDSDEEKKTGTGNSARAILAKWLVQKYSDIDTTSVFVKSKPVGTGQYVYDLTRLTNDLMAINSSRTWRILDEEAAQFLAMMKLYSKATKVK